MLPNGLQPQYLTVRIFIYKRVIFILYILHKCFPLRPVADQHDLPLVLLFRQEPGPGLGWTFGLWDYHIQLNVDNLGTLLFLLYVHVLQHLQAALRNIGFVNFAFVKTIMANSCISSVADDDSLVIVGL